MRNIKTIFFSVALLFGLSTQAWSQAKLPSVNVKTPAGKQFNIKECLGDGVPVIISFWSLTCKPCIQELNTISDLYPDWQDEADFKVVIVSTDDARNSSKAAPFARGKGWGDFTLLLDSNQDLKRAMGVEQIPTVFVVKPDGEIAYKHIGYAAGNEQELIDKVKELQ